MPTSADRKRQQQKTKSHGPNCFLCGQTIERSVFDAHSEAPDLNPESFAIFEMMCQRCLDMHGRQLAESLFKSKIAQTYPGRIFHFAPIID